MKDCRKRQVERRGDEVTHRCINKKAEAYKMPVCSDICDSCPVRVFLEQKKNKDKPQLALPVVNTDSWPSCEFRLKQGGKPTCSVTGLPASKDICQRCAKDEKMETASLLQKPMNYLAAVRRWTAAGRPERTEAEMQAIYDEHCSKCAMFDKDRKICNSCGCPANTNQPALRNKLRMATEECPLGRFPAKVKTGDK